MENRVQPSAPAAAPNGGALAAALAAGIGAFAMGVFVILHEAALLTAPALYAPAGALSGRSTLAVVAWLTAWAILHARWRHRDVAPAAVLGWTLALAAGALIMTFPLVWTLL